MVETLSCTPDQATQADQILKPILGRADFADTFRQERSGPLPLCRKRRWILHDVYAAVLTDLDAAGIPYELKRAPTWGPDVRYLDLRVPR